MEDAWLRRQGADRAAVRDPGAFLATTATRLAINERQSARARRETYVLREAFDYSYREIAEVLDISEVNARRLAARARARLEGARRVTADRDSHRRLLGALAAVWGAGRAGGAPGRGRRHLRRRRRRRARCPPADRRPRGRSSAWRRSSGRARRCSTSTLDFFTTSTRNQLAAEAEAGVGHHVALSVVGARRMPGSGYMRAKVAQVELIAAGPIPHTIVQATQFFEFVPWIADASKGEDGKVPVAPVLFQPIAAAAVARAATGEPVGGPSVGYFGAEADDGTLVAGPDAWLGERRFADTL